MGPKIPGDSVKDRQLKKQKERIARKKYQVTATWEDVVRVPGKRDLRNFASQMFKKK